jgi:hypothetical protein
MIIIDRVQMNFKTMLLLTGISVAVFVVSATISLPLQTSSAQNTNTISVCQQSNTTTAETKEPTKSTRR